MKIKTKGEGISILLTTEATSHNEWKTFATWYSLYQNLPEANVAIACARRGLNQGLPYFNWVYRCSTPFFQHKNVGEHNKIFALCLALKKEIVQCPVVIIDPNTIAIRPFSGGFLDEINNSDIGVLKSGGVFYFNNQNNPSPEILFELIDKCGKDCELLAVNCQNHCDFLPTFAYFENQCAKFNLEHWEKKYNVAPFAYATKFKSEKMTVAQNKILSLWNRIANTYEAIR